MGVSAALIREHIRAWKVRLSRFPMLANWPEHLFHTTDVLNAVEILRHGRLACRCDLPEIPSDVANQDALWNNPEVHGYVRLYFRPKTMFHLSTEGIKCVGDPYRRDPHMSIPVMLAFDAESILTRDEVGFSQGKLSRIRKIGVDEEFFGSIDFASVYHDGPPPRDRMDEILDKRMAEVVVPGELALSPSLRRIICRTALERRTLLHHLGPTLSTRFEALIRVEQIHQSTFFHRELYLTDVSFRQGILALQFHRPRRAPQSGKYRVELEHILGGRSSQKWRSEVPEDWSGVRFEELGGTEGGVWRILLEDVLAYEAPIPAATSVLR